MLLVKKIDANIKTFIIGGNKDSSQIKEQNKLTRRETDDIL